MVDVPSMTTFHDYCALPFWLGNVAGGVELFFQTPCATFFLLIVTSSAVFLEVSPLPLLGSARLGGSTETSASSCSNPCQQ